MTMKVRDEEDILEANLRYHFAHGVDFAVVHDDGSVDDTPRILERYRAAGLVELLDETPGEIGKNQTRWHTTMARLAASEFGADWVLSIDADEFWWPVTGATVKQTLAAVPAPYGALTAPRPEYVPVPDGPGSFAQRMTVRQVRSRTTPKVAHRGTPDVLVAGGSHRVAGAQERPGAAGGAGRFTVQALLDPPPAPQFASLPHWPVRILHFPNRSREQFLRRMRTYAFDEHRAFGWAAKRALNEAELPADEYWALVAQATEQGVRNGHLVTDTGLRDFLAGCPDPTTSDGLLAARAYGANMAAVLAADDVQAELDTLALDVMEALARKEIKKLRQTGLTAQLKSELLAAEGRARALKVRNRRLQRQVEVVRGGQSSARKQSRWSGMVSRVSTQVQLLVSAKGRTEGKRGDDPRLVD